MIKASECLICPEENLISLIYLLSVPRMQTSTGETKSLYYICCYFFKLAARLCFDRLSPAAETGSDMSRSEGLNALFHSLPVCCCHRVTSRDVLVFWLFSLPSVCLSVMLGVMFNTGLLIFVSFSVFSI